MKKGKCTKKYEHFNLSEELTDSEAIPRHLRNGILCPDNKKEPDPWWLVFVGL